MIVGAGRVPRAWSVDDAEPEEQEPLARPSTVSEQELLDKKPEAPSGTTFFTGIAPAVWACWSNAD